MAKKDGKGFEPRGASGGGARRGGPMGQMGAMTGPKAKDAKGAIKRVLSYMGVHKKLVKISILFAILSTVASIAGPKILGLATTELFEGIFRKFSSTPNADGTIGPDFTKIGTILLTTLLLYAFSSIFMATQGRVMAKVSTDVSYKLRKDISEKMNKLPLKYFDGTTHGEVLSRVTNDVDTINQTLSQSVTQAISSVFTVIGVMIMMFTVSWQMTLAMLLVLPISMGMVMKVVKKSQVHFKEQQKLIGDLNGHVEEMYSGHVVMKSFNGEEKSIETFSKTNNTLYKTAWKAAFLSGLMMPLMMFIGNLGYVVMAILGGYLAFRGTVTVGDVQAFTQYVRTFMQPMGQMANISNIIQQTGAAAERVFEFLDEEEEIPDSETPLTTDSLEGRVEFKNITFGYNPEKIIINDFSAIAESGKKIAIVGPTGAGKTTIVKLLMRFYDLNKGEIFVDGISINDYTRKDLRDNFGMVLQDTWLYNGSIMDNIRYGNVNASDEEVIIASKAAHVDEFVHTLPNGYDMILNEEANNVSEGQRQLLTIARAVLKDPKILILDEATSSVDTRTELLIQKAMDNLMKNRTSFIIAHRLSTIKNADLILVMKDGDIVETGNHQELIDKGGFYADLHNSQFDIEFPDII